MKDSEYVKINSVNPFYLIIGEIDEYFEEKNGNKYFIVDSTDESKEALKNYAELWNGIKNSIGKINNRSGKYEKGFMKIKFNSDDNFPLNKTLQLYNMTIIIRSFFEDGKYYPQDFLDECLYEL